MDYLTLIGDSCVTAAEAKKLEDQIREEQKKEGNRKCFECDKKVSTFYPIAPI